MFTRKLTQPEHRVSIWFVHRKAKGAVKNVSDIGEVAWLIGADVETERLLLRNDEVRSVVLALMCEEAVDSAAPVGDR